MLLHTLNAGFRVSCRRPGLRHARPRLRLLRIANPSGVFRVLSHASRLSADDFASFSNLPLSSLPARSSPRTRRVSLPLRLSQPYSSRHTIAAQAEAGVAQAASHCPPSRSLQSIRREGAGGLGRVDISRLRRLNGAAVRLSGDASRPASEKIFLPQVPGSEAIFKPDAIIVRGQFAGFRFAFMQVERKNFVQVERAY